MYLTRGYFQRLAVLAHIVAFNIRSRCQTPGHGLRQPGIGLYRGVIMEANPARFVFLEKLQDSRLLFLTRSRVINLQDR